MIISALLVICIFIVLPANAQWDDSNYELRGNLREWVKAFVASPAELDMAQTQLKLELISTVGANTAFKALTYYNYEGTNKTGEWNLQQAYVDYYSRHLDVRFGKQTIAWGKADELNPTDILNPQNLANTAEDKSVRKIGLTMLKTDWRYGDFTLTGIWKPEFDYMKIPEPGSRWGFLSLPESGILPEPTLPGGKLSDTEYAFKLARTGALFDFSISYCSAWDHIYTPKLTLDPATQQLQIEELCFHRTKMIAADFAGSIASVGVWGEGAFFLTEDDEGTDPEIKNPYLQLIVGTDYTFACDITVNIQYYREEITKIDDDEEKSSERDMISKLGLGLPLDEAISFRVEKSFGFGEAYAAELFGIVDLGDRGMQMGPKFSFKPEDALKVEMGALVFMGDDDSLFGRFDRNDVVYLKCTYSF